MLVTVFLSDTADMELIFCPKGFKHAEFHHIIKVAEDIYIVCYFVIVIESSDFSIVLRTISKSSLLIK